MKGIEGMLTVRIIISTVENLTISSRKTRKVPKDKDPLGLLPYDIGVLYLLGYNFCSVGLFSILLVVNLSD